MAIGAGFIRNSRDIALVAPTARPIESVRAGDLVASQNVETGVTEYKRVLATTVHKVIELVKVVVVSNDKRSAPETITTTGEHPFYVRGRGFVAAGQLCIGNAVITRAGPDMIVRAVTIDKHPEGVAVYNYTVEGDHTYFVGNANGGVLVHNACTHMHHIYPQQFRPFLERIGLLIDNPENMVELDAQFHWRGVHGKGGLPLPNGNGVTPGRWNQLWKDFIEKTENDGLEPEAARRAVKQFAAKMKVDFGLD